MNRSRHRFLVEDWPAASRLTLPESEAKHAKVARIRDGEEIEIFDGRGRSAVARSLGAAAIEIVEQLPDFHREPGVALTLAVAPLKKDRFEWLIEKATEIGVARIVVFEPQRAVAKPSERKRERWHQTAVAAAKQCGRTVVPPIDEAPDLERAIHGASQAILLHERSQGPQLADIELDKSLTVAIGPEGGFAEQEIAAAEQQGATIASLGHRVLRAETAALVACALVIRS